MKYFLLFIAVLTMVFVLPNPYWVPIWVGFILYVAYNLIKWGWHDNR